VTDQLDPNGASATFEIEPALPTAIATNKAVYQIGQPVEMTFVETNTSSFPIIVLPSGTFTVTNTATGVAVFSQNVVGQNAFSTLLPGQSITKTASWTATEPGNYGLDYSNGQLRTDGSFQVVQTLSGTGAPVQNPPPGGGGNGPPVQTQPPVTG